MTAMVIYHYTCKCSGEKCSKGNWGPVWNCLGSIHSVSQWHSQIQLLTIIQHNTKEILGNYCWKPTQSETLEDGTFVLLSNLQGERLNPPHSIIIPTWVRNLGYDTWNGKKICACSNTVNLTFFQFWTQHVHLTQHVHKNQFFYDVHMAIACQ